MSMFLFLEDEGTGEGTKKGTHTRIIYRDREPEEEPVMNDDLEVMAIINSFLKSNV